ncbi:MAG TPA: 4-alpha-glucanotransferase [Candidatus Onthovivens sp.]|nr:4-alpha-glucanotransferase [Candidatus Onthovivens sp.]
MNKKESGILLHISSLPSKYGVGTLGKEAFKFVDFLSDCGFSYWVLLPLEITGYGNSPYQNSSAFGSNFYFIDFEALIAEGLLSVRDLQGINFNDTPKKVSFTYIFANKLAILKKAFKRFDINNEAFQKFKNNRHLLKYAIYMTAKELNDNKAWFDFPLNYRYYDKELETYLTKKHSKEIDFYIFLEFIFQKQWAKLHEYAKSKNIEIAGEVSHFLNLDSDEMYTTPQLFLVDKRNQLTYVAGYPPDEFSDVGQKWGNPLYDWDFMKDDNYRWWNERINRAASMYDRVKLNHFQGFKEFYAVPFRSENAKKGSYMPGPGLDFFKNKEDLKIVAANLGYYTDSNNFVDEAGFKSMKVTNYGFFGTHCGDEKYLPSRLPSNCYAYIGNHDNKTLKEYIESLNKDDYQILIEKVQNECRILNVEFGNEIINNKYLHSKIIELLFASNADSITLTMQDILFESNEARMNIPGILDQENWTYRFLNHQIKNSIKDEYKKLNKKYMR